MTPTVNKAPRLIVGRCQQCNRRVPHGALYTVLKWITVKWGERPVQTASEILCRDCGKDHVASKPKKEEPVMREEPETDEAEVQELSPGEIAKELYKVMSKEEPHSSKVLAKLAEIEYSDAVVQVLKALEKAGKVVREDNGWWRLA